MVKGQAPIGNILCFGAYTGSEPAGDQIISEIESDRHASMIVPLGPLAEISPEFHLSAYGNIPSKIQ